ncbi:MAG: aminotransferase class V-fold PLP-dependent enzyme [Cyclobacteriaceae bacterium]
MNSRRKFLKSAITGIAGTSLLPHLSHAGAAQKLGSEKLSSDDNSEEYWEMVKNQFLFTKGLYYFNNGSLGPSPSMVRSATNDYRKILDEFPSRYMWGGWNDEKETVRKQAAGLLKTSEEEIAIIHNTTEGMNLIARSFDLKPGDEIILADHEHTSGTIPWQVWQETKGIKIVKPILPIIPKSVDEIVSIYKKAITPKTKIISMCHIVNTNGMTLPVKEVSELAHSKGILVAVDGAQAAGMLDIDLHDMQCDFYAASSHKWLFSPKGVGIFYARKESQHHLKPLIVCNGHTDKTIRRLENYNTRNLPEVLGLGAALQFNQLIGSKKIEERTFELKNYFRAKFEGNQKYKLKTPVSDQLSGAIQTLEVVGKDVKEVQDHLFDKYGIDTRPMSTFGLNGLRISLAIYNTKQDVDYLTDAIESII